MVLLVLGFLAVIGLGVVAAFDRPEPYTPITTEQYVQWRAECTKLITETIDTRVFQVGGDTWTAKVNECLLARATD